MEVILLMEGIFAFACLTNVIHFFCIPSSRTHDAPNKNSLFMINHLKAPSFSTIYEAVEMS